MRPRTLLLATGVTACLLLSGCGSGPPLPSAAPNGEAAKSADQIYSDAVAQLRAARSVHISGSGSLRDARGTLHHVSIDGVATADAAHVTFTVDGIQSEDIVVGGKTYEKGGTRGSQWVRLPPSESVGSGSFTLRGLADCATSEHGRLSKQGATTYHGNQVVVISDNGSAPGAAPTMDYVALEGPPRFIHQDQTGTETPGGSEACGHTAGVTTVSASEDLDQYGAAVDIQAPPGAAQPSGPVV